MGSKLRKINEINKKKKQKKQILLSACPTCADTNPNGSDKNPFNLDLFKKLRYTFSVVQVQLRYHVY